MTKSCLLAIGFMFSAFSALNGYQVHAQPAPLFQVLSCPAIGDEYEQMISKLDSIKTSIKKDANCTNVQLKVDSLQELVTKDREAVMAIVKGADSQPLTDEQAKTVRDYAENVTKKVAALNDLFTQSNYCFRDDQAQNQLSALAGFVGEASQVVASLSGPWGAPIALAGNVIAGFMTGMDAILKSRAGYDYSKPEQWKNYVTNLCTYYSYRDQIEHLLNPTQRLAQLQTLRSRLNIQIEFLESACTDCMQMAQTFEQQKNQGPAALAMILSQQVEHADKFSQKPYGTYMLQSLGLRDWVDKEQVRVNEEAQTYWSDASGRHVLSTAKEDIEDFLITREAPKFLLFGVGQSRADYGKFLSFVGFEGPPLLAAFQTAGINLPVAKKTGWFSPAPTPMSYVDAMLLQPIDWTKTGPQTAELQYQWTHFRDEGLERFRNAQATTQVVQSFCAFFRHASFYSSNIHDICVSPYLQRVVDEETSLAKKLTGAGVWGITQPLADGNDVYLNRLEALTKQIEVRGIGN